MLSKINDHNFPYLGYMNVIGDDCFRLIQQYIGRYQSLFRSSVISNRAQNATNRLSAQTYGGFLLYRKKHQLPLKRTYFTELIPSWNDCDGQSIWYDVGKPYRI